jgi:hypothetical protein
VSETAPGEAGRRDRVAANYRAARRDKRCGTCASFDPKARNCSAMPGLVAADMVCDLWTLMPGLYRRDLEFPPRR